MLPAVRVRLTGWGGIPKLAALPHLVADLRFGRLAQR